MSDVVFILGAGASKDAGAPVMSEFFSSSRDLFAKGLVGGAEESFRNVFEVIGNLQRLHSKCDIDLQNVESVFTVLEMADTLGKLPGISPENIKSRISDLKALISKTVEQTVLFEIDRGTEIQLPPTYGRFCDLIKFLQREADPPRTVAVITFNYDVVVDRSLAQKGLRPDYCIENETQGVRLLKLHGSLNWLRCPICGRIQVLDLMQKQAPDFFEDKNVPQQKIKVPMPLSRWLTEFNCCEHKRSNEPLIVPPTWNKSDYHKVMLPVWRTAVEELESAENIFVIGYSFPQSDAFFHHLYGLGSLSEKPLRRFWVFNPDTETVEGRFRRLLGTGVHRIFEYHPQKFNEAISTIANAFGAGKYSV